MGDMRDGGRTGAGARLWAAGFGLLALLVQVLVPQGFMVARAGGLPAVVICTGHGPVLSRDDLRGSPAKAPEHKSNMVCDFAAHGGCVASPTTPMLAGSAMWSHPDSAITKAVDLAPGRGLAAPPPPSQAPPFTLA
jgi:Protein of unknown function (DUF2946)